MNISRRIHWMRVLIGGFLVEASLFAVVIPVLKISGQYALLYVVPVASFVMCFVFGLWGRATCRITLRLARAARGNRCHASLPRHDQSAPRAFRVSPRAWFEDVGRCGGRFRGWTPTRSGSTSALNVRSHEQNKRRTTCVLYIVGVPRHIWPPIFFSSWRAR